MLRLSSKLCYESFVKSMAIIGKIVTARHFNPMMQLYRESFGVSRKHSMILCISPYGRSLWSIAMSGIVLWSVTMKPLTHWLLMKVFMISGHIHMSFLFLRKSRKLDQSIRFSFSKFAFVMVKPMDYKLHPNGDIGYLTTDIAANASDIYQLISLTLQIKNNIIDNSIP